MRPKMTIVRDAFPEAPGLDTAIGRAMLLRASDGQLGESFRIHVPGRIVAFGKHDALSDSYDAAVRAAHNAGFLPILRLAGGRAAVFHESTLAFHWTVPDPDPTSGITQRFETLAQLMVGACSRLGIAAEVGEVPGEYCPGQYSVNLERRYKVMGVGQRLARNAAHVGGVVVVSDVALTNLPLVPVYAALGVKWQPEATGSLEMARPGTTTGDVADAILAELSDRWELQEAPLDGATRELAQSLVVDHLPGQTAAAG